MRADLLRAYEEHQRRTAETDGVIAKRAGIARENLSRILRKLRTGEGDVESETLRRVAGAIGLRWTLVLAPVEIPNAAKVCLVQDDAS